MVFGPFHYCAFCERAAPDAPETIDDQRRGPDVVIGQSTAARAGAHPSYGGCQAWIVGVAIISFFNATESRCLR